LPLVVKNVLDHCKGLVDLVLDFCSIGNSFLTEQSRWKLETLSLAGNPILDDETPNENLVNLVVASPLLASLDCCRAVKFQSDEYNSNWKGI
jgi:hypothetical protein